MYSVIKKAILVVLKKRLWKAISNTMFSIIISAATSSVYVCKRMHDDLELQITLLSSTLNHER